MTCIDNNRFNTTFPQPFNNNTSCKASAAHGNQITDIQSATAKFAQLSFETAAITAEPQNSTKKLQFSDISSGELKKKKSLEELTEEANLNAYTLAFLKKPMTEERFCNQYIPYLVRSGCNEMQERFKQYFIFLFQEAMHSTIMKYFDQIQSEDINIDDFIELLNSEVESLEKETIELNPQEFCDKLEADIRIKKGKKLFPNIRDAGEAIRKNYSDLLKNNWDENEKRTFNRFELLEFDNAFVTLYKDLGKKLTTYINKCHITNNKKFKTKIKEMLGLVHAQIKNKSMLTTKDASPPTSILSQKKSETENKPIKAKDVVTALIKNLNLHNDTLNPTLKLDTIHQGHIENLIGEAIFNLETYQMKYVDEQDFFKVVSSEIMVILTDSKHLNDIGMFNRSYREDREGNIVDIKKVARHYNKKIAPLLMNIDLIPNSHSLKSTTKNYLEQTNSI